MVIFLGIALNGWKFRFSIPFIKTVKVFDHRYRVYLEDRDPGLDPVVLGWITPPCINPPWGGVSSANLEGEQRTTQPDPQGMKTITMVISHLHSTYYTVVD